MVQVKKHFSPHELIHFNRILMMKIQVLLCNDLVNLASTPCARHIVVIVSALQQFTTY